MTETHRHNILIVDDDDSVARSLARTIKTIGHDVIYAPDAETAMEKVEKAASPFSLMIVDQQLPGMTGSDFFEKVRDIYPDSIRFLLTGFSNLNAIIASINRGAIHFYIQKPWKTEDLMDAINMGVRKFEQIIENQRLFQLAKDQNEKLLELSRELKIKTETNREELSELDREIEALSLRLEGIGEKRQDTFPDLAEAVTRFLENTEMEKDVVLKNVFDATMEELSDQFREIAVRNGFVFQEKTGGDACEE